VSPPEISLSFRRLALAQGSGAALAALFWAIGVLALRGFVDDLGAMDAVAGVAESGLILLVSLVVLALFTPSKLRPVASVPATWSATSFVRFIIALLCSSLLYYVAQFGLRPLLFSFLLTAVFLLVAETRTLASMLSEIGKQTEE
jgi:hypothetical protein